MTRDLINLTGETFGAWHVLARIDCRYSFCRCTCGSEMPVRTDSLRGGRSTGCQPCRRNVPLQEIVNLKPEDNAGSTARVIAEASRAASQLAWRDAYYSTGGRIVDEIGAARVIPVKPDMWALCDEDDYALLASYKWRLYKSKRGNSHYAIGRATLNGKRVGVRMHQMLFGLSGQMLDHIDLNGLHNRRHNLRPANHTFNNANVFIRTRNSTGYKGVVIQYGRFVAQICAFGKNRRLGIFMSGEAAARAYDAEARKHFGEFARTNFPENQDG